MLIPRLTEAIVILNTICCSAAVSAFGYATPQGQQDSLFDQAIQQAQAGDLVGAQALAERELALHPSSLEANDLLGDILLRERRFTDAMQHFEAVLVADKSDPKALKGERNAAIGQALALRRSGKEPEAFACLQQARTLLPEDPTLLTDLGIEAHTLHFYNQAADALEASLKLKPGDATTLYALARVEVDRDRPQRAEALFRAYLEQRPDDASAHYGLGHLLQVGERIDEATAELNRSIALQPIQTEAYYQLGQIALDAGQEERAAFMFAKTLGRLPTHGGALTGLGILAYRRKDYTAARVSLQSAVASSPEYQPAHYYLGLTFGRLGDKEAAKRELDFAMQLTEKQQGKSKPVGVGDVVP